MSARKLKVVLTRRLPDTVETRLRELFDAELNLTDRPMSRDDLAAAWLHQLDEADRQRIAPLFANAAQPLLRHNGHSIFPIAD